MNPQYRRGHVLNLVCDAEFSVNQQQRNLPSFDIGRGLELRCRGWRQEGMLRMLENTLANGERPEDLIVYGGSGKVARNWDSFRAIVATLKSLRDDETMVIQSGKPVAVFQTHEDCPRVLAANTNLVGKWATWDHYRMLEAKGLMMYGQYTAGTWAYIGTQGILQGTYETFAACGKQLPAGNLRGSIVLTAGLGGMGGAQPLAVKMAGGVCIAVEIDRSRAERRVETGYCDVITETAEEALSLAQTAALKRETLGIALIGNAVDLLPQLRNMGLTPAAVTDQTSAHDPLYGYIPQGLSLSEASELRSKDPKEYTRRALDSMSQHIEAMLDYQRDGAIVFEYGNYLRGHAKENGTTNAFEIGGFVPMFIRPSFARGRGPLRWICLSGDAEDLRVTDEAVRAEFPDDDLLQTWMDMATTKVAIQGLPARTCWLGMGDRERLGALLNGLVQSGKVSAPVVISRDHLDTGSVAQPTRETEAMKDGSDAVADWPLLNALLNASCGADLVTIHQGAGSGMGGSISAGHLLVADGTTQAAHKLSRCLHVDPGIGVIRHADAGYEEAEDCRQQAGLRNPMEPAS
jgi:urocanate hydratase